MLRKYGADAGERLYDEFQEFFRTLPLAHLVNGAVFVCHGGLSRRDEQAMTLEQLDAVDRYVDMPESIVSDLLWADPCDAPGITMSERGALCGFGPDVTEEFCAENNVQLIVRSHQVQIEGWAMTHGGKVATVFSAPNYGGTTGNRGAIANIEFKDGRPILSWKQFGPARR